MLDGLFYGSVEEGAGGIVVTTAVEVLAGEEVHIDLAFGAERKTDAVFALQEESSEMYRVKRQTIVYKPFSVTYLEIVFQSIMFGEIHVRGTVFRHYGKAFRQGEPQQFHAALRVVVIDFPMDVFAVYA